MPAADVNVVDVMTTVSDMGTAMGTVPLANSTLDALGATDTVIPRIFAIAPVTTPDGFCAGWHITYENDGVVHIHDTGNASLILGTDVVLNDLTDLEHIRQAYSSPDQQSTDYLAMRLVIEDSTVRDTTTETIDCGRFQDEEDKKTNLVCNPYSSVIGFDGMAWAANGALTEITATSVPINGGVSAAQLTAYQTLAPPAPLIPWYD